MPLLVATVRCVICVAFLFLTCSCCYSHSCIYRWVSICFVIVAKIRRTKIRQSDSGIRERRDLRRKVPRAKMARRGRGVLSTASELKAVPIPRKETGERLRKGGGTKKIVDNPALDQEGKAYPLERDVVKGALTRMNWKRIDDLSYVGLGEFLNAKLLCAIHVKGCEFCTSIKRLIRMTAQGGFNQQECSWGPLWRLESKTAMELQFARYLVELEYTQWLVKLYREVLSGHSPVFWQVYCCFFAPYDRISFLSNSRFWWSAIKFE